MQGCECCGQVPRELAMQRSSVWERWLHDNGLPGKVFFFCSGGNWLFNAGLHTADRLAGAEMAWVWQYVRITVSQSCLCWRSPCQQLHNGYNIANGASQAWEDILGSCNMCSFDLMALLIFYYNTFHAPFCCSSVWKMFSHVPVSLNFSPCTASPKLLHYIARQVQVYGSYFSVPYELIFILYSAVFYNSFSRWSPWKPQAVPALLFTFYTTLPLSHPPFFFSPLSTGGRWSTWVC